MRTYTLDPGLAKQVGVSQRIQTSGAYVGRITRAEFVTSQRKTEGIELSFEADNGQTADYLSCWTHNVDGEELYGLKVLNAILTCMSLRTIEPKPGTVTERDGSTRQATLFPALMKEKVGLVLQRENYYKTDGSAAFKFNIVLAFGASSRLTAAEILARATEPQQLDRVLAGLTDKAAPKQRSGGHEHASSGHPSNGGGLAGMDDDIPF